MDNPLALYEAKIRAVADVCADPWFGEQLSAFRAGDELALRRISGSALSIVLDLAKRTWYSGCPVELLDLVQEGNAVLVDTIRSFCGKTAEEFIGELRRQVELRFRSLVEHPDLLG
jgi:hypothetical protein